MNILCGKSFIDKHLAKEIRFLNFKVLDGPASFQWLSRWRLAHSLLLIENTKMK